MGIQRQDSKSRRRALLGAMRLLTEDLSQCLLKARLARPHQYAMRQPSMPSLLVDHGITVQPHLVGVDRRHGLPPPCACLHTTRTKKSRRRRALHLPVKTKHGNCKIQARGSVFSLLSNAGEGLCFYSAFTRYQHETLYFLRLINLTS